MTDATAHVYEVIHESVLFGSRVYDTNTSKLVTFGKRESAIALVDLLNAVPRDRQIEICQVFGGRTMT